MSIKVGWSWPGSNESPCCCESCCMYPAAGLGVDYTVDDLPDTVTVNWPGVYSGTLTKSGDGYSGGGVTLEATTFPTPNGQGGFWELLDSGTQYTTRFECLITGPIIEDQFEDSYTVNTVGGAYPGGCGTFEFPAIITVFRINGCTWEGTFTALTYVTGSDDHPNPDCNEPGYMDFICRVGYQSPGWYLEVGDMAGFFKSGSTPTGNYEPTDFGISVS